MQLILNIPDEVIETYRRVLPPPELGLLQAVAVDAILGLLSRLEEQQRPKAEES
jgi:hypothetical protein